MKLGTLFKPLVAAAMGVCAAIGGADAATASGAGGGVPVTVTVKDWTGKVVTTVRGVTFDGNFKLDTADHFNGKVDYVTAFDGGTVVKNGVNSERASSSVVTYEGISGESFATEVFVQPYVPTAAGYARADPFLAKAPNENRWVFTGTTGSSLKLASLSSFPSALNASTLWLQSDVSNFADGYSSAVWAPEILYVQGNWYIYFSASSSSDTNKERSFVMSYKGSSSSGLSSKANWNKATRIVTPDDKWAIDGTVFEGKDGKLYYVWSGWAGNSNVRQDIYLAPMDTPTTIAAGAKRTLVSIPDQDWETKPADHPLVEEGPAVLQKGDKTIIVFSGNGSWKQYYSLGYTVCSDGNYTNAASWKKHEGTVFTKRSYAYGPGHCSFTKDANGQDYIIYHATATATAPSGSDYWSIRNARVQPFAWHDDEPVFGAPRPTSGDGLAPAGESYSVTKSWTKTGSADKTFVHAPTAETVTGKVGSTVSPTFLANDYFTVSGTTSLSESKTVTLTLALKDASTTAWDDGTTGSKTCKFTAELTGEPTPGEDPETPVVHSNVSTLFGTINVVRHAAYGERQNLADEGAGYVTSAASKVFPAGADDWGDRCNAHETAQTYDVYYPATVNEKTRVVLFVHGGSYMAHHDAGLIAGEGKETIGALLAENLIVYSMNYIMPQNFYVDVTALDNPSLAREGATFDGMLRDIDLMMTELKADVTRRFPSQAEDLLSRCVIWGESAGAHLVTLYAYDAANPTRLGLGLRHDVAPCAVINMAGPVDFSTAESLSAWEKYGNVGLGTDGAKKLSRVLAGGRDAALYSTALLAAAGATPTVLDYSQGTTVGGIDGDGVIPFQQYQLLKSALDEKNVMYRTVLNSGCLHGQELKLTYPQALAAVDEMLNQTDAVAFDAKFVDGYVLNWGVENTLTGTATPGKAVRVWYDDGNGYPMLEETVTASAAGVWSVTFIPPAKESTAHPIHAECGTARATFSAIPNGGTGPEQEEPQETYALELPTIFANDMVLQRDRAVLVWGRVTGGKTVTVALKKNGAAIRTATAVARADGVWEAQLCTAANPLAASKDAHALEVTCPGETAKTFTNVRIGDVWISAGQSNMAFWIGEEVHYADYKSYFQSCSLRVFTPVTALQAATDYCQNLGSYQNGLTKSWSALACYFLRDIMLTHPEVPQMLISIGVGASYSTRWFPPKALARIGSVPAKYPAGDLWNAKLSALTRFTVRGVLWHQGEADSAVLISDQRFANYDDKLTIIAEEWRRAWGRGAAADGDGVKAEDMAFYWFDLAMDHYGNDLFSNDPSGAKDSKCQGWWQALNRCGQFAALEKIANGGLAVTYDFGHPRDIHPPCKKPVGERLARWARRDIYGESDLVVSGPIVTGVATDGDALVLTFAPNTAKGLKAGYKVSPTEKDLPQFFEISDAHPVSGFAISADGKNWAWAKVAVVGDPSADQQIRLTADGIAAPKYVHHNYLVQPCGDWQETDGVYTYDGSYLNLYNSDGLPCPAFATIGTDWSFTVGAGTGAIDDPHQPTPPGHTHVWSAWTTNQNATCEKAGVRTRTCTAEGCGDPVATETQTIPALGHHLVADPASDREATCEQTGVSGSKKCDRAGCTHKVAGSETPKVDHVYVDGQCQWCHRDEPELPSGDVESGPIPGRADWGYVNAYKQGEKAYAAYVYTNVTAAMTFTVPADVTSIDYLVVAGGGAGGKSGGVCGGGGGAGGLLTSMGDTPAPVSVTPGDVFTLSVGAGGETGVAGSDGKAGNGFDSVVARNGTEVVHAIGGGTGGSFKSGGTAGGSGGGAGWQGGSGGAGVAGQGFPGGNYGGKNGAGGGGGAKEAGKAADGNDGAAGGDGLEFSITGEFLAYAAGGGGGGYVASGTGPVGGAGGSNGIGGTGGPVGGNGTAGKDGTGSGGGGAGKSGLPGNGGSGVIVLRYVTTGENPPEPPPVGHTHVWSAWTVTTAATCEQGGVETRTCTAEGCSDPAATETQTVPALGHDWGEWQTTKEADVGVAGEQQRTCQRTGCGKTETQAIPAKPEEADPAGGPVGREITSVTLSQDGLTCALAFASAGEGASDLKIWAVADLEDRGTDGTNGWSKVASVGILEKTANELAFVIPSDFGWGTETKVMRFLTTPAYDATLTGLTGAGTAQMNGPYIDTGFTPHLKDNKVVVDFTPSGYSSAYALAVASARTTWNAGYRLCVFLSNTGTIRLDYQTGTGANGQINPNDWTPNTRYVATFDGGASSVTLKGLFGGVEATKSHSGQLNQTASGSLLVFAARTGTDIDNIATEQVTVHEIRVYGTDGKTVHDYIPVVADGVNTLYDKVDGKVMPVSMAGSGAGNLGAEGTPSPVLPLSWSVSVSRDEPPSGDVESGPIPGHADWGYVNAYKQGEKAYAAYVYTNVTAAMTFTVPADVTSIDYLVVAGGGAGGRYLSGVVAGGGGAGGLLQGTDFAVSAGDTLTLTVGKGGVQGVNGEGRTQANSPGEDKFNGITSTACNGFDSVVARSGVELLRAYGGAGGGAKGATKRGGGSGGGTGAGTTAYVAMPGTEGQGHDGGARESAFAYCSGATGGGGAGSAGGALTDASSKDGTNGGEGLQSSITGELLWYAAGGGGAAVIGGTHGKGGNGIGGDGDGTGTPGAVGTGSGGGGSSTNGTTGGNGGSGVIVLRYVTAGENPPVDPPQEDPEEDETLITVNDSASWTAWMQGIDTEAKLAVVKAAVSGQPAVKIAIANFEAGHDEFQERELSAMAAYYGLAIELVRIEPTNPDAGRTLDVVYREAFAQGDIVIDYKSYWTQDECDRAASVIENCPEKLFVLPYGEAGSPVPPTSQSLQGRARHADGSGLANMLLTIPIVKGKPTLLTGISRRTADDTATAALVSASGWASGTGDTCQSASMAAIAASLIVAARGDSPSAAEIIRLLEAGRRMPRTSELETVGFTDADRAALQEKIDAYATADAQGRKKLLNDAPLSLAGVLEQWHEQHVHDWSAWTLSVAATCEGYGCETRSCSAAGCADRVARRTLLPLGHEWGEWTDDPTDGARQVRRCGRSGCAAMETRVFRQVGENGWGWKKTLTEEGVDYEVLVFTNVLDQWTFKLPVGVTAIDYVVVAGGGGGGAGNNYSTKRGGGGGGAGGLLHGTQAGTGRLIVSVGKGGAAGKNGFDSTLTFGAVELTAVGGGAGVSDNDSGKDGGSGGGGGGKGAGVGGAGIEGQGHKGGARGGGGGGYATAGVDGKGGAGGAGYEEPFTGLTLAKGGAGGTDGPTDTPETQYHDGLPGAPSTGNGGDGAYGLSMDFTGPTRVAGAGGSGVVIVRYALADVGGEKPTVDGKTVEPAEVFETATSAKPIKYPSKPTLAGEIGAQTITFDGGEPVKVPPYYTATLGEDQRTVTLELNDNAKPAFGDETAAVGGEENKAVEVTDGTVKLHLTNVRPELYYTLERCDALGGDWQPVETQKGDQDGFNGDFKVVRDSSDPACFYQVSVSDTP